VDEAGSESIADDSYNQTTYSDAEPELVCDAVHVGDVTDLLVSYNIW